MLASTGNKSEMAVGYSTLYGDLAGGFSVIKDVYKTEVYAICHWINKVSPNPVFPENILTREPLRLSSEKTKRIRDSLPDYPTLDAVLKALSGRKEVSSGDYATSLTKKPLKRLLGW